MGDTAYALDRVYPGDPGFALANTTAASWHGLFAVGGAGLTWALRRKARRTVFAGAAVTGAGLGILIAAEVVTQVSGRLPVPLIAASTPVIGVGALILGSGLLRVRQREIGAASLVVGGFALAGIIPTSLSSAGANYFVIAAWGLCWALLGAAALRVAVRSKRPRAARASVAARGTPV